ncbi:glycosyltransferase [Alphaproteobacteria bacterium]|nr:glycosyltransferase [Alphaproteobacteria bacterium]MDA9581453.1 glycosyltransferase [bacterium]MDA8624011.1 glycosyltransferase [Alphaproteobacteria bacterium]MDA8625801.1 glycosyltransferase [Alphaproteobacteria bacterium]MDA8642660.1 glycosyltransferase [Alphaproteobacteria bacterium]
MSENPKITVMMSVRNGERYLEPAIESILMQSHTDFEFFITDDGSNDRTSSILTNYAERHPRIRIFQNESSLGLPSCLNMMAKQARGKYLARMDADDIAHNSRFERQVAFMDRFLDIDACFTNVNLMHASGRLICARRTPASLSAVLDILPFINYFAHPTAMIRNSSFKEIGGYNELFFKGQDWELWQRMVANGMRLEIIREVLLDYRLHTQGNSSQLSGSVMKSDAFSEANILIQNGCRAQALALLHKLSFFEFFEFLVRFLMPWSLFLFFIKLRAKHSRNSPQRKLLEQGSADT